MEVGGGWYVGMLVGRVLQLFTHVNSGVALHVKGRGGVGFGVQDRRLLANTHWPSTTNNTEGTRQFLDLSITSVNMSLNMSAHCLRLFTDMFTECLQTVYRHVQDCLQACLQAVHRHVYRLFTGMFKTFTGMFTDCLQSVYRLFTNCLQTVYRHV